MASLPQTEFERHLSAFAGTIAAHLERLLPAAGARAPRLVEAMRYALLAPGKRIRPFFVAPTIALGFLAGLGLGVVLRALDGRLRQGCGRSATPQV